MNSFINPYNQYFGENHNLNNNNNKVYYETNHNHLNRLRREEELKHLSPTQIINPQKIKINLKKKKKINKEENNEFNLQENIQRLSLSRGLIPYQTPKIKKQRKKPTIVRFYENQYGKQNPRKTLYPITPPRTIYRTPKGVVELNKTEEERYLESLRKMFDSSTKKPNNKQPPELGLKIRKRITEPNNSIYHYTYNQYQTNQSKKKIQKEKRRINNLNSSINYSEIKRKKEENNYYEIPTQKNNE